MRSRRLSFQDCVDRMQAVTDAVISVPQVNITPEMAQALRNIVEMHGEISQIYAQALRNRIRHLMESGLAEAFPNPRIVNETEFSPHVGTFMDQLLSEFEADVQRFLSNLSA